MLMVVNNKVGVINKNNGVDKAWWWDMSEIAQMW